MATFSFTSCVRTQLSPVMSMRSSRFVFSSECASSHDEPRRTHVPVPAFWCIGVIDLCRMRPSLVTSSKPPS